jgi:hypothetical protein
MGIRPQGRPNPWRFHDMLGNVREWCWDLYDPEVYGSYPMIRGRRLERRLLELPGVGAAPQAVFRDCRRGLPGSSISGALMRPLLGTGCAPHPARAERG